MKIIELADATQPLADYARNVSTDPVLLTVNGKPVAALVAINDADIETVSLGMNPQFLAIIERSRARQNAEGGLSGEEVRRRLGLKR
jgi:prevent-host-death family protein